MRKKKTHDDDDNRVIAPMNVDGMPWYQRGVKKQNNDGGEIEPLTKKETFSVLFSAILAGLAIALVMVLAGYLFILFCIHIWFR